MRRDPATLRHAYDLLVFPGHHEYVTEAEYDNVEGFRDLGGDLVFLSANNFFWRIDLEHGVMTRVARWRELGRPEASLLGVQFVKNDMGEHRGPWLLRDAPATAWLFADTGARVGGPFSNAGIEIDHTTSSSPPGNSGHRGDPESPRAWTDSADDLLRDGPWRKGLLGRGVLSGRVDPAEAGRAAAREHLGQDGEQHQAARLGRPVRPA